MTTQEQNELYDFGGNTTINVIVAIITSTGYGAMVLMMFVAMYYLSKKQRTIPVITLATGCMVMFVLFTIQYLGSFGFSLLPIAAHTDESPQHVASYEKQEQYWTYTNFVAPGLLFLVGDVIVVWRAWVLLPTDKFYKFLLLVLMSAGSGINIADIVLDYKQVQQELHGITNSMDWIIYVSSLLINLLATLLIWRKLWAHQRSVIFFVTRSRGHNIQRIMILLIESGAFLGITQVMNLGFVTAGYYNSNPTLGFLYAFHFFTALGPVATALYPLAVIILVNTGNSPVHVATVHVPERSVLENLQAILEHNHEP
ncbi:hypothetical protein D9757_014338 [Collybiopsis confluens]|uniref:Uncharacterized protein n=1 Tax=Collybiopsis confluens TaxID=2823264 RepID=A0A8H5CTD9_9AGAR|nr:hypothetical protein D9757_014338 [Collybiopsis confluens]